MATSEQAKKLQLLLLDVDGVMTDGGIYLYPGGEAKKFDVQDGLGVVLARRAGMEVGIITGRVSEAVRTRAEELGIERVYQGYKDKNEALEEILKEYSAEELAYIGDDVFDLPVLRQVGLALAPSNARPAVREVADYVSEAAGGSGAIREIVEWLLKERGEFGKIMEKYF